MRIKYILLLLLIMSIFSTCSDRKNEIIPKEDEESVTEEDDNSKENDNSATENLPSINYEDNELKCSVAYKRCSGGEENPLGVIQFPRGEAYYFKDSVPKQIEIELIKCWIILFDSKRGMASLYTYDRKYDGLPIHCLICNFPDFAKAWDISENGCKVFFEGLTYRPSTGGTANQILCDYVLTTLKRE